MTEPKSAQGVKLECVSRRGVRTVCVSGSW